jgi:addiction module HigA family antidote
MTLAPFVLGGLSSVSTVGGFRISTSLTIDEGGENMPMKNPPHPGGFVRRQCIEPLGLTITAAAAALGMTRTTLSELVNERRGVSPEMAVRLSKLFGGSAESWLVQQAQYDLAQVSAAAIKLKRLEVA